jgi:hypothetical protein
VKYFLSFLGSAGNGAPGAKGLALGIPSEAAASLRFIAEKPGALIEGDEEEQRFSVPLFLGFPEDLIRHGIILRGEGRRRVLLLTAVEREIEYSGRDLYRPPGLLRARGAYSFLAGLCFRTLDSGDSLPLLLIDPFKLVEEMAAESRGQDRQGGAEG